MFHVCKIFFHTCNQPLQRNQVINFTQIILLTKSKFHNTSRVGKNQLISQPINDWIRQIIVFYSTLNILLLIIALNNEVISSILLHNMDIPNRVDTTINHLCSHFLRYLYCQQYDFLLNAKFDFNECTQRCHIYSSVKTRGQNILLHKITLAWGNVQKRQ